MYLCVGLQSDFIDPAVCFYANSKLFYYWTSVVDLKIRDGDTSRKSFIVQDYFIYSEFFVLPYNVEYCSFTVHKELCWDFNGDYIESVVCI